MADEQKGKLDKDLTDSENVNHSTDKTTNAPVIVQLPPQRKRGYLTNSSVLNTDGNANTSISATSSTNLPKQKKSKKEEVHRKQERDNSRPTETTTSDYPSQSSDVNNVALDLPTQGSVPQREPIAQRPNRMEEILGWAQFLIDNLD